MFFETSFPTHAQGWKATGCPGIKDHGLTIPLKMCIRKMKLEPICKLSPKHFLPILIRNQNTKVHSKTYITMQTYITMRAKKSRTIHQVGTCPTTNPEVYHSISSQPVCAINMFFSSYWQFKIDVARCSKSREPSITKKIFPGMITITGTFIKHICPRDDYHHGIPINTT